MVWQGKSPSILNFFRRVDSNSTSQKHHEAESTQSHLPSRRDGSNQETETWHYKVDEIDPSVIDELPPEFQEEVRAWLRPHKRPNVVKRGSSVSIASFFSSSSNL